MIAVYLAHIIKRLRFWLCLFGLLPGLVACVNAGSARKVPLEVPFFLDKVGKVVALEVLITEHQNYTFGIGFIVNRKVPGESERVLKLIGTTARNSTGKYIDLGVPLRVRLEIESLKVKGTPYRLDFETSEIALYAGPYTQYQKKIVAVPLDVGTYRITVTNLLEASQFQGTLINFHIRQYSFMK